MVKIMANINESGNTAYSSKQRAVSLTLGVACTIPLTTAAAVANAPTPGAGWQTHASFVPMTHANVQTPHSNVSGFSSVQGYSGAMQHSQAVHAAVSALFHSSVMNAPTLPAHSGADLNLASTKLSFLAGNLANFQDLTIDVGGHKQVVNLTTKLTGAELVAAQQVLSTGTQTIKLSAHGTANGGTVNLDTNMLNALDNSLGGSIGSLTISHGVQVIDSTNALSIGGNLANYGSIFTASGSAGNSDNIAAGRIVNAYGGTIGSYTGDNGLFAADPILTALTSITNAGSISSSGNLTLNAPVIYNVASGAGAAPSITAHNNVNINTQNLDNTGGVIAALTGNVNVASNAALNVIGTGGTIQALNGNVNFASNNADINISGGNVLSQTVNMDAGKGTIIAQFDDVTGVLNASACNIHVGADTDALKLGVVNATDDPTFTNTGDLLIDGSFTATGGNALTLIAGQNIISAAGNVGLDTTGAGAGGNLTLIAGAAFTPFVNNLPPTSGATTVTKGSTTGGYIDLTGGGANPITKINTSGAGANSGGSVQMVAFAGSVAGSGAVKVPTTVAINAGSGTGTAGDVTIIAGAKTGQAVTTGAIIGNKVTVDTAAPVLSKTAVSFDINGVQNPGSSITGAATANAASISLGNVNGTALNINTASTATVVNAATDLNLGTVAVGKTGVLNATATGKNIVVNQPITGLTANLTTTGTGTVTGAGSVNTTNFNLTTGTAASTVTANTTNFIVNTGGGDVTLNQGINPINVSGKLNGAGNLTVNSAGQVNFNAPLFLSGNTLKVTASGKAGIKVNAPIFLGAGTGNLTTTGTGLITETAGNVFSAKNITLTSLASIGSKSLPFATNASSNLTVNDSGAKSVAYVSDQNFNTLTFDGNAATPAGGSLFLTSTASKLSVNTANYNNVSITDTLANANGIDFSGTTKLGTGVGAFTAVAASKITQSGIGAVLEGTTVSLNGVFGIGTKALPVFVDSANLVLNSAQGSIFVSDSKATTVNGSASLKGTFNLHDTGTPIAPATASITVGKSVGGGIIDFKTDFGAIALTGTTGTSTTSSLVLDSATVVTTKGAINAAGITFTAVGPVTIGGAVGSPTSNITLNVTGTGGLILNGTVTGNQVTIDSNGPVSINKAIAGTGAGSVVDIAGAATTPTGNAVVIGAAITGETIKVHLQPLAEGNIAINAAVGNALTVTANLDATSTKGGGQGSLTGTGLVTGTTVDLAASNSVGTATKLVNTAAGTLNISSGAGGTDGAFIQQKGNLIVGNSKDSNLVLKVTGNVDVSGVVTSPAINISSTGSTTIEGTVQNTTGKGPTSGAIVITTGTGFTVTGSGNLITTNDQIPVTVTVKGTTTVNGNIAVDKLNLTTVGLTIGNGGVLAGGTDNITATGPIIVNGQLGATDGSTVLNVVTTGSFTLGISNPSATVLGSGNVKAATIANYATITGAVVYTATGAGNAFQNFGTISGQNITVTTTNPAGVIFNAPGAVLSAVADNATSPSPTLNLNTYGVNNQGTISAVGQYQGAQGILNITSPGALTISGVDGGFKMDNYAAVNLKAVGNITVGGIVGGVNSNPFSLFNSANELGNFTVNTTGTFSSTMPGVSVLTNTTGTFGGVISFVASNIVFNGVAGTQVGPFALDATGAGPAVSLGKSPITVNLSGAQGITVGTNVGNISINVEGFDNTTKTTLTTPGALTIDTKAFDVHYSSLALTGQKNVLISGDLNEGTKAGTSITIFTTSASPFLIGNATTNGLKNLGVGDGITANTLTINAPGAFTLGTVSQGQELVAPGGITLNSASLLVNSNSDIVSNLVTLNATGTDTTYSNLNANGGLSAYGLTISAPLGVVNLVSGDPSLTNSTFTLGANPDGTLNHITGGTFTINASSLNFAKNLHFEASSPVNGGQVHINLAGITPVNVVVGSGKGQISANVSSGSTYDDPVGSGRFDVQTLGSIVADLTAVNFGGPFTGGNLSLISVTSTVKVSNVYSTFLNLYNFSSGSTIPFVMQGATGGNGITDGSAFLKGGNVQVFSVGPVVTNGFKFSGVKLDLSSADSLDISGNPGGFHVSSSFPNPVTGFSEAGTLIFSAPTIKTDTLKGTPTALFVDGGTTTGGSISITTTVTPVSIGVNPGQFYLDVGTMMADATGVLHAGSITVTSPGALSADLFAVNFLDLGTLKTGVGGNLTLQSAPGFNMTLDRADQALGLNFSTATFIVGSTATPFKLSNATTNGFIEAAPNLVAGKIVIDASNTTMDATGYASTTHDLVLSANSITFAKNQVISVLVDGLTVGTGLPPGKPSGSGGNITLFAGSFNVDPTGGVTLNAKGDGSTTGSKGGAVAITQSVGTLNVNQSTFNIDVSNADKDGTQVAGSVNLNSGGDVVLDGKALTFGVKGGSLGMAATNILISSVNSLNQGTAKGLGLDLIEIQSNSATAFQFGGASSNGFVDPTNPTLTAQVIKVSNSAGDIDTTGGVHVSAFSTEFNTTGTIIFGSGDTISAAQDFTSKAGGTIKVSASAYALINGAPPVILKATAGDPAVAGGSIIVDITGGSKMTIGNGGLSFDVHNTTAGSTGSVTVSNGGDIDVDATAFNFGNTKNGSLSLTSLGSILVTNAASLKTGSGLGLDKIAFTTSSTADFALGNATLNGFVGAAPTLTATEIDINANGVGGVGGIDYSGAGAKVQAHTLLLNTPNTVTLDATGLVALADPASGDGGTITVNASAISAPAGALLSAKGVAGTGGNIVLAITTTSPFVIGAAGLKLDVSTAGTTAGNVTVTTAGDISIDGSAITYGKAGGSLTATGNNLLISKVASLTPQLKQVTLTSLSANDFDFGGATLNGFADLGATTLKADGVTINVNLAGKLTGGINTAGNGANITTVTTHTLALSTLNTVTLLSGGTLAVVADAATGDGGSILINAGNVAFSGATGTTLTADAKSGLTAGLGGIITINNASTSKLTVGAVASGGLTLSVKNIATFGGGKVTVNNGGAIDVDGSKIDLGGSYGASTGADLVISANGVLSMKSMTAIAALNINNLTLSSDSAQDFNLGGATVGANGVNDLTPTYKAANITVANNGGAIVNGGSLGLNGTGTLILNASTDIGTIATPLLVRGPGVSVQSGGNTYLTTLGDTGVLGAVVMGDLKIVGTVGDLAVGAPGAGTFSAAKIDVTYVPTNNNTVTVGSATAFNGDLSVVSNAKNFNVLDKSQINDENGSITLQNVGGAAGANIAVGKSVFIHSTGALPNTADGNIFIITGVKPSIQSPREIDPGVTPGNAIVYQTPGGEVTFGTVTNKSGTITVAAPSKGEVQTILSGLGRHLVFNNGAGNITVGADSRITADPPGILGPVIATESAGYSLSAPAGSGASSPSAAPIQMTSATLSTPSASSGPSATSAIGTASTLNSVVTTSSTSVGNSLVAPTVVSASVPSLNAVGSSINQFAASESGITSGLLSSLTGAAAASQFGFGAVQGVTGTGNSAGNGNGSGASNGTNNTSTRTLSGGISESEVSNNAQRTLDRGALLLAPDHDTVVATPYGAVNVAAQSVALLISSDKGLAVYNLHDGHKNAVVISGNGKAPIALLPGCSMVLTGSSAGSFEEVNPAKFVGYRRMVSRAAEGNAKVYQAEFEIMSLIRGLPALKDLMRSDSAKTRKTIDSMLKTAAILMQLSPGREPYALYLTPEVTAYAASAQR